jgi:hypothetical protein
MTIVVNSEEQRRNWHKLSTYGARTIPALINRSGRRIILYGGARV